LLKQKKPVFWKPLTTQILLSLLRPPSDENTRRSSLAR